MRLGDLDALLEELEKAQYSKDYCIDHHIDQSINMSVVRMTIKDAPTVEAHDTVNWYCDKDAVINIQQIRPQGKWITKRLWDNTHIWVCSECGNQNTHGIIVEKACWKCGAEMRGGKA